MQLISYGYKYDALNRIKRARYKAGDNLTTEKLFFDIKSVNYDKNGNIKRLDRFSPNEAFDAKEETDHLTYKYFQLSNRLKSVTDATGNAKGFKDGNTSNDDYAYDTDGNLTSDANKGITKIKYNHLNLPTLIKFNNSNTKKIKYFYDASGVKLKKVVTDGSDETITDYMANGSVYENDVLQFIPHAEGYVTKSGNSYSYVYNFKDHLGSIRLSYSDGDGNGTISQSEIIEENHYYPYGLKMRGFNTNVSSLGNSLAQKYRFNGMELDESFEVLNTYDFGARNYDPALGRWMNVDPLADQRSWVSPYNYVQNNPISRIDPTGALDNPIYGTDGEFLGTDDRGLQGDAIVMNKKAFKQGMSHNEAKAFDNGTTSMSDGAKSKMNNHFNGLSSRPDYDGFVTIKESVAWAKSHPGVKDNPSASDALYINSAKLNFGSLSVDNIGLEEGEKGNVNLFNFVNFFSNSSRYSTYALGNTQIQLLNAKTGAVKLFSDAFDWDFHEPWTPVGGYPTTVRDNLIRIDRANKGLNNSHGFPIYMYGVGTIKTSTK